MNKKTTERLIDQYNTLSQRPTVQDKRIRNVIFKSFAHSLGTLLPRDTSAKILDAGCGEGAFLDFLREQGYKNLAGFELSSQNVSICHSIGLDFVIQFDALSLYDYHQDGFDAIFALDLIEHLPKENAVSFIDQLYRLLKPGGYAVIQTPNMGSITSLYIRYNDLSHEFGLTEKSATSLFALGGFEFDKITVFPCWRSTTFAGFLREKYLGFLNTTISAGEGADRPHISTRNLLIKAVK